MAVETRALTDAERRQLKMFFEQTRSTPQLLATLRSRRVALGYAIESGEPEPRASGRTLVQEKGPLSFKSAHEPVPLSELEEALIAWSACGPNGTLFGPYQFNLNRQGQTWFIPITDVGWLYFSVLLNLFDAWHLYFVDDADMKPAGVEKWIGEGKLEFPITISQIEQFMFQV